jgi:hypothetical protein
MNSTYTLVAADDNANIRCRVTATDDEGSRSAFSNTLGPVLGAPLNLVTPVLSGTEAVGEELSVTDGTWQGQATITFAYQWRRNGSNISGATSSTYTLVTADYDAVIDCVVTATNSLDSASADSNDTGAIAGLAPVNTVAPSISGSTGLGDTLTRTEGTWSGVPTPSLTGQWRRNGVVIPGETGATYTIVAADSGADIDYLETATNAEGSASADSNDITVQTFTAPTNDVAPSITGNDPATIDDVLTRVEGTWSGNPTPVLTGEWYRNNVATGETGSTYTVTAADDNSFIFYRETATNAIGSASEDSAAVTVEDFTVPVITGSPTIAGTEEVGETLTATAASATGNPTPVRTWQWQRSDDGSTGWADISGATNSTYLLDAADEGKFIRGKQIETNALGSDEAVSAASGEIQAGGAAGLLDSYKGSAFAMAPDTLLYSTYSGTDDISGSVTNGDPGQFSVAILRDSDNAVRSFTPAEVADGTANTWVQAAGAANGLVRRAYDQSVTALDVSNLNHADQATTANMPKLFDSSTGLILENGKAAIKFDGSNDHLIFTTSQFLSNDFSYFLLIKEDSNPNNNGFINIEASTGKYFSMFFNSGNDYRPFTIVIDQNNKFKPISAFTRDTQRRLRSIFNSGADNENASSYSAFYNSVSTSGFEDVTAAVLPVVGNSRIGVSSTTLFFNGKYQSIILFNTDQSTNRPGIETAINNEYSIYP